MLASVGLFLVTMKRNKLSAICGLAVLSIAFLTLLEYMLGINIGLDQFFIEHYISTKTSHVGRMAPNTALCFLLTGAVLLLNYLVATPHSRSYSIRFLSSVITVMGIVAIMGYVADFEAAYGWENLSRMALHTSLGFVVLGVSIIVFSYDRHIFELHSSADSYNLPIWFSSLAAVMFFVLSFTLWEEFSKRENAHIKEVVENEMELVAQSVRSNIITSVLALERMAQRWQESGGTPRAQWEADARHYVEDNKSLTMVGWVDETYHVRWVEPFNENKKAVGLNIVFDEERSQIVYTASNGMIPTLTSPLDLVQGYRAFIAYIPISMENKFSGFMVGVYQRAFGR